MSVASQKPQPFTAGKNQLEPGQESMGDAPVFPRRSLLRNPWPEPTGILEQCRLGEKKSWFSILRGVSF